VVGAARRRVRKHGAGRGAVGVGAGLGRSPWRCTVRPAVGRVLGHLLGRSGGILFRWLGGFPVERRVRHNIRHNITHKLRHDLGDDADRWHRGGRRDRRHSRGGCDGQGAPTGHRDVACRRPSRRRGPGCGGARRGADLTGLNLARVLADGEQIVVGVPAPSGVAASAAADSGSSSAVGGPPSLVNINTADQPALETLPGIGPVTAQAILQWRAEHGAFTAVDELLDVSGIGDATLAKVAPFVTV
jgi:comEA protein